MAAVQCFLTVSREMEVEYKTVYILLDSFLNKTTTITSHDENATCDKDMASNTEFYKLLDATKSKIRLIELDSSNLMKEDDDEQAPTCYRLYTASLDGRPSFWPSYQPSGRRKTTDVIHRVFWVVRLVGVSVLTNERINDLQISACWESHASGRVSSPRGTSMRSSDACQPPRSSFWEVSVFSPGDKKFSQFRIVGDFVMMKWERVVWHVENAEGLLVEHPQDALLDCRVSNYSQH